MSAKKTPAKTKAAKKQSASRKKAQGKLIFALDIGTRNVVGIVGQNDDGVFSVLDSETCAHTKRAMKDGQIEEIDEVAKVVKNVKSILEERLGIRLSSVSIAAAGRALKTQRATLDIDIPSSDPITDELERSFEIEAVSLAQHELDKQLKGDSTAFYCVGHSVVSFSLDGY
ncbi:MAG: cell division protein FtsA, partial [Oscillospiraceae bacterium]